MSKHFSAIFALSFSACSSSDYSPVCKICLLLLLFAACKSEFANKSYVFRASVTDGYAYRELRLYPDSTFQFFLDPKSNKSDEMFDGRYSISADTLILRYNNTRFKKPSRMIIGKRGLYNPFITDSKGMKILYNKLSMDK